MGPCGVSLLRQFPGGIHMSEGVLHKTTRAELVQCLSQLPRSGVNRLLKFHLAIMKGVAVLQSCVDTVAYNVNQGRIQRCPKELYEAGKASARLLLDKGTRWSGTVSVLVSLSRVHG